MRTPQFGVFRVQAVDRAGGRQYTILEPAGDVHMLSDAFLRLHSPGTSRTYAFHLVDHLRWLEVCGLTPQTVNIDDLRRYMGALGAEHGGPSGIPWRIGKAPYSQAALDITAACLKGFYSRLGSAGFNPLVGQALSESRLPIRADRRRHLLGHVLTDMPTNQLRPVRAIRRRHPKMLPEGGQGLVREHVRTARDRMILTWLEDGGFRVGELCSLHVVDLHLRENAPCGQCLSGADLLYWRRKREQWHSLAERAPDDSTAAYLHQVFAPTAQAIDGLERALAALGLLDQALAVDLRRPQDYFHRVWDTAFRTSDLAAIGAA